MGTHAHFYIPSTKLEEKIVLERELIEHAVDCILDEIMNQVHIIRIVSNEIELIEEEQYLTELINDLKATYNTNKITDTIKKYVFYSIYDENDNVITTLQYFNGILCEEIRFNNMYVRAKCPIINKEDTITKYDIDLISEDTPYKNLYWKFFSEYPNGYIFFV